MSSFRIDRQYVSFVTAETHSVYAPGQRSVAKGFCADTGTSGTAAQEEELQRHCSKIFEKAQIEADKKAESILARARTEAEAIVKTAKHIADETLATAQKQTEQMMEDAKQAGYAEGQESADACADTRKSEEAKELQQMTDQLKTDYSTLVDAMRCDVISLVIEIVKKIINIKLNESDAVFVGLINDAIERLKQTGTAIIHVGSEDYNRYFGSELTGKNINTGTAKVVVIEEESYSSGDLVVESEGEMLDFSICRQIEAVETAFSEKGR